MANLFIVNFATIGNAVDGFSWDDLMQVFSPYVIEAAIGYLVAELIKLIILAVKNRRFRIREIFKSGGMPSSHTATVVALAVTIGLKQGFGTALFGLAAVFVAIVVTDATHVRRAVGEQGEALRKLIDRDHKQEGAISEIARETGAGDDKTRAKLSKPYLARGHTAPQVIVGGVIGVLVGVGVCLVM